MKPSAVALLALTFSGIATATPTTPLSAQQILEQFNLVALGDVTTASHVHGRSYVGGSLSGGEYANSPGYIGASDYAGLTVAGSANKVTANGGGAVIGGSLTGSTIQGGGTAAVLGSATGNSFNVAAYVAGSESGNNFNGGHLALAPATLVAADSTDFAATLGALSTSLSQLASTGGSVTTNGYGRATFNAVAKDGLAVFDLTQIDTLVFSQSEFEFNLNGASTVIINVDEKNLKTSANFLADSAKTLAGSVIWNFYNATDILLDRQFGGSILATSASLKVANADIEGNVYVKTLAQTGQIHAFEFTGDVPVGTVPEPETLPLLLGGLALVAGFARRKRA